MAGTLKQLLGRAVHSMHDRDACGAITDFVFDEEYAAIRYVLVQAGWVSAGCDGSTAGA